MTAKRIIRILAIILVVILLACGALFLLRYDKQDNDKMQELYTQVEPLQREREAFVAERSGLDSDYALKMRDPATVQVLFRELSDGLFADAYPVLRDRGIVGIVGISLHQFPGRGHQLTLEQFNHLMKDGWGTCLVFENDYSLNSWFSQIETLLNRYGIAKPTAMYFPDNTYNEGMNDILREHGIETIVLPGETGHAVTVSSVQEEFWYTVAMPWNYTGVNADMDLLARTDGANLTYTVSFSNLWDAFDAKSLSDMLDSWEEKIDKIDPFETETEDSSFYAETETAEERLQKPLIRPTTYENAKSDHLQAIESQNALTAELLAKQQELDEKIAELDEQIRLIYERWQMGS